MIASSGISAVLATKQALLVDLVTLTIKRGHCWQFDANGLNPVKKEILDTVRWTSAPRPLRANVYDPISGTTTLQLFQPLSGVAYQRGSLASAAGAEVLQLSMSVAGPLPVYLSTAQDGSGSFASSLMELALLGLLDGAQLTIDQAVVTDLPATPTAAGATAGTLSPDPVRVFGGVVRGVKPTAQAVEFDACDPLIQGGGAVPRNLFSPACQWEFAGGNGCPVGRTTATTNAVLVGASVAFPDAGTVSLPGNPGVISPYGWGFLVPQDGPMMGMRFQVGAYRGGNSFDFADRLPWAWSCTAAHLELSCSKAYSGGTVGLSARSCSDWAATSKFGGSPDMPAPESA
jgi:hypothetical protein